MKTFLKRVLLFFVVLLILTMVFLFADSDLKLSEMANPGVYYALLILVAGSVLLAFMRWLGENRYIPYRKRKLIEQISSIFHAQQSSENVMKFELSGFNIYAEIILSIKPSEYFKTSGGELIRFHIPQIHMSNPTTGPGLKMTQASCNGIPTWIVYQTNGLGLRQARKRLETGLSKS